MISALASGRPLLLCEPKIRAIKPLAHVTPNRQPSFFSLLHPLVPARVLWTNRGLFRQFTLRNVEMRHKGSFLGMAWTVLNPLLMLSLYIFVFGFIFGGAFGVMKGETRWDYGLGIFLGLAFFNLFAESVSVAPGLIASNPNFVKRVVFPLEVLPAAAVGSSVIHMSISLAMVLAGMLLGGRMPGPSALLLVALIPPVMLLALGLVWFLSALGVFFRDIGQIVAVLVTGWMFASGIFYPISQIPPGAWAILKFNPLIHIVDMARNVLLWDVPVPVSDWLILYAVGIGAALVGHACFARLKPAFADVI